MTRDAWVGAGLALMGCRGGDVERVESPSAQPVSEVQAVEAPAVEAPTTLEASTTPTVTGPDTETAPPSTTPTSEARPDAIGHCLWYAARGAPPTTGLGSLEDLDQQIADAQPDRRARVIGRVRLAARGCPTLSVGLALIARADAEIDDDDAFPIASALATPVAGPRGDERRDGPWVAGAIEEGVTSCLEVAIPTLVLFRATHARDGAVEGLAFQSLGEVCTVIGHDLDHGDVDDDGSTEIRVRTRTSGSLDMGAGRDRVETLRVVDVAGWHVQTELEVAIWEDAEVDGYGGRARQGDITLRDLDADGDRDLVFTHRDEDRMRSNDDSDEESYRSSAHEAFVYDGSRDLYTRAPTLDPH